MMGYGDKTMSLDLVYLCTKITSKIVIGIQLLTFSNLGTLYVHLKNINISASLNHGIKVLLT